MPLNCIGQRNFSMSTTLLLRNKIIEVYEIFQSYEKALAMLTSFYHFYLITKYREKYIMIYYITLYCIILYCVVLYYVILHYIILYYIILCCVILCYAIFYYTTFDYIM